MNSVPLSIRRVGELATFLRELLESNDALYDCWVAGEVSNLSQTASGHYFFTLKDSDAQIKCVLFRQKAIWQSVLPQHGRAVLAHGYVSIYEATGTLQFYVDLLQEEGQGALYLAYEQLKAELEAQGLFAPDRKRPIPEMPRRIGLVTSPQAAALQDILTILSRRYPLAEVVLAPTAVQGDGAARQVAAAIAALNTLDEGEAPDVIIVARGGGSIEELWAFNEEVVARAAFLSRIPIISGVGHETDFTIVDYVADVRAPTPSAAAELATPDIEDLTIGLMEWQRLMLSDMRGRLAVAWDAVSSERAQLERLSPVWQVARGQERVEALSHSLRTQINHHLALHRERLHGARDRLQALSPLEILKRGYAIARDARTGRVLTAIADARPGRLVEIQVADGSFEATIEDKGPRERDGQGRDRDV